MLLHEGVVLRGDADVLESDIPGKGAGNAVGAGEIQIIEGDVLDGLFFKTFDGTAIPGVAGDDVVNMDVAEQRGALGKRLFGSFGIAQGKQDRGVDVLEAEVGGGDVFDDAAATAGALDADAVVGAVAGAVQETHMPDAAGFFAADGADAVAVENMAAEVGDIFGRTVHFPAFLITARLDAEGVIANVGKTIMHQDMAARIGVQAIRVGRIKRGNQPAVADVNVLAIKQVDVPERGVDESGAFDANVFAIFDLNEHRTAADGTIGAGIAMFGHVHGCPPDGALAVKGAAPGDGDVVEAVGEDEWMRAVFGETFPTRGHVGVLRPSRLKIHHRASINLQRHVVHHVNGAGEEMTGRDADDAAAGLPAIGDGPAKSVSARNFGVIYGSVGHDVEYLRMGGKAPVFSGFTSDKEQTCERK